MLCLKRVRDGIYVSRWYPFFGSPSFESSSVLLNSAKKNHLLGLIAGGVSRYPCIPSGCAHKKGFLTKAYIYVYIYTSLQVNQVSLKVSSCRACSLHSGGITPTPLSLFRGKTPLAIFYSGSMNLRLTMHGCDGAIRCNTCVFVFRGTKRANIFYLENLKNKHFVCDFPTQFFVKQYKYKLVSQTVMILVGILSAA